MVQHTCLQHYSQIALKEIWVGSYKTVRFISFLSPASITNKEQPHKSDLSLGNYESPGEYRTLKSYTRLTETKNFRGGEGGEREGGREGENHAFRTAVSRGFGITGGQTNKQSVNRPLRHVPYFI